MWIILPCDECFSINRVIIGEINNLLSFKCSVNRFQFIDQSNRWTLNNDTLDFLLIYSDDLHLVEKGNLELGKSILNAIDSIIIGSKILNWYKNAVCSMDFNLNLEDFPKLPSIVPVHNSVSFSKSIIKVASISSVCPGKFICDSNVHPSKSVSASFVCTGKPISNKNVHPIRTVSASSVSPGKPICDSNVSLSKHVSAFNFHPSKPIIRSNIRSSVPIGARSVCSSKPIFSSSVYESKPICAINVRTSKPISEHVSVINFCPGEPISSSHACSSNVVSASNVRPSKTVSASNVCSVKPVCINYVCPSRSICGNKLCQSKPTSDSNIHHKPTHSNHICFINSSVSTQQISFIFLLSLLAFSVC